MENTLNTGVLDESQKKFSEFSNRGDDFFKIELFRHALQDYKEALTYKADDEYIIKKIQECENKIKQERNIILVVVGVIVIAVLLVILFK